MKAVVCHEGGPPEVLSYEDAPDPVVAPDQLLIEVRAAGIQGGEVTARAKPLPFSPVILGGQVSGVVREVGSDVTGWQVGQRVMAMMMMGGDAELVAVSAQTVFPIPDSLSFESAAATGVEFATAQDALFEFGHLEAGQTVLVQAAASGVGVAAVQLAKKAGATVLGTASSDERLSRLGELGLDVPINYTTTDVAAAVMEATGGRGVDLVVELGGPATIASSLSSLAYRGRITLAGAAGRVSEWPDLVEMAIKHATITGMFIFGELGANPDRVRPMIDGLIQRVASGELTAVVDSTFPLSEAAAAHRHIESRQAFGRVVLVP